MFAMGKRIFLFLLLNVVVVLSISLILSLFNVQPYLTSSGLNLESLAAFCLIWGMTGSLISLALSKQMAKWTMGVQIIPANSGSPQLRELHAMVRELSAAAGIPMPEIGVYDSPELNAFATGPTKNHSLVAVSAGLLNQMDKREVRGVLAHEISHIANGDMVTMTLLQGVVNAFVMFLARAIAFAISQAGRSDDERSSVGGSYFIVSFVLEILFMIVGAVIVNAFSRFREYRADAGGARLAGRDQMIAALQALQRNSRIDAPATAGAFRSMQIDGGRGSLMARLFSSHPPLDQRIARLKGGLAA